MHCMHIINAILNYKKCNLNYRGDFRMGETLYRRPEILFRWGRLCFDTESPGGISYQSRGDSVSGETLFCDTGRAGPPPSICGRRRRFLMIGAPPPSIIYGHAADSTLAYLI